eukprot:1054312-Pyramimonas_sp.AAC.1
MGIFSLRLLLGQDLAFDSTARARAAFVRLFFRLICDGGFRGFRRQRRRARRPARLFPAGKRRPGRCRCGLR